MTWITEFGSDYDVPARITTAPDLPDASWHNDACPAFGRNADATDIMLWVEHPDPDKRELDGGRFTVSYANGEHVFYAGDNLDDALGIYRQLRWQA